MKVESTRKSKIRKVVIDTNVWISAILSSTGVPSRLVRLVLDLGLPVFSSSTFSELETRIWRPKFDPYVSVDLRQHLLHDLNAAAFWVEINPDIAERRYCRDIEDDKFIHTALSAEAQWLVTGDKDLLEVTRMPELCIFEPTLALQTLAKEFTQ